MDRKRKPFCNPKMMTHQRTVNERWNHHTEASIRIGHSYSIKISLNRLLRNYKGKNGTFTVKKSGGHQVIKVNITNNGINWQHVPPDVMHWGHNITYVLFLPKMHNLKLVMRKQSDKPKTEGQSINHWPTTFKIANVQADESLRNSNVWSWIGSWIRKRLL